MSKDESVIEMHSVNANEYTPTVEWRDVQTTFVDAIVGFALGGDAARISFGEIAYNPDGGQPIIRPVITLAGSLEGWANIMRQLNAVFSQSEIATSRAKHD